MVVGPHLAAAVVARPSRPGPARGQDEYDVTVTLRRDVAVAAATALLTRVAPLA